MPAVKSKRISTLIETQLPAFISDEYELFSKFVQKYYEAQEVQGGTLDVINNLQKYADIDYYEKNILKQFDTLDVSITTTSDTIVLQDATSFPKQNGFQKTWLSEFRGSFFCNPASSNRLIRRPSLQNASKNLQN